MSNDREDRGQGSEAALSHVQDVAGGHVARMVDVAPKVPGERVALARALLRFPPGVLPRVLSGEGPKGPLAAIEEIARAAGVLAAKRTADLIPLCHPLGLDHVELAFARLSEDLLEIRCKASCTAKTGVEMEALVGASLAALTVYDMTKALDPAIRIEALELLEKHGGKRGLWRRA